MIRRKCSTNRTGQQGVKFARAILLLAFVLVWVTLQSDYAHAVALGVNRATLNFADVLRSGYAEEIVVITTDSEDLVSAEVIMEGEAATWFNGTVREFNFSASEPYSLRVIVQPPKDAQIQSYKVNMQILTGSLARIGGGKMGTSTRASFRIPIAVQLTGTEIIRCNVGGVQVLDTEKGQQIEVYLKVHNLGNVQINPDVTLELFDQTRSRSQGTLLKSFGYRILPTVANESRQRYDFNPAVGQYWAAVSVPLCQFSGVYTFDVLEPGAIKDDGDFIRIDAKTWAQTGEIIPIKAIFRNKGTRGVRAIFKGTIVREESKEIVKVISSDEYVVDPGATAEIETFFNPTAYGQYVVQGKIHYNNKLTIERSTIINVNGSSAPIVTWGSSTTLLLMLMVAIILVLLILVKRRRKGRR